MKRMPFTTDPILRVGSLFCFNNCFPHVLVLFVADRSDLTVDPKEPLASRGFPFPSPFPLPRR